MTSLLTENRSSYRTRRRLSVALVGFVGTVLLASCSGAPSRDGARTSLTLYNGQHVQTTQALVAAFEKQTGIQVNLRNDDENTFDAEIVAEGGRSPADVFFAENSPALEYLGQRHLLAPVGSSTLAKTPARYSSARQDWVGVSARVSVLIYNPALISKPQLPRNVRDLASPAYRGKLALAPGETDFQPIVTSVARAYGQHAAVQWLDALKANAGNHLYPDDETITNQVNRGIVALGIVNQYYWYRLRSQIGANNVHARIAYFAPRDPGYVIDVSGAAVLRSSRHQQAAQRFLAFLVSKQGESILAHSDSFEYPLGSQVPAAGLDLKFGQLQPNPITIGQLGTGSLAISLLRQSGLL